MVHRRRARHHPAEHRVRRIAAPFRQVDEPQARVPNASDCLRRLVGAAVPHDDQLEPVVALLQHRGDAPLCEEAGPVIGRHADADQRHFRDRVRRLPFLELRDQLRRHLGVREQVVHLRPERRHLAVRDRL